MTSGNFEILSSSNPVRSEASSDLAFLADAYDSACNFVAEHPFITAGMVAAAIVAPKLGSTLMRQYGSGGSLAGEAASAANLLKETGAAAKTGATLGREAPMFESITTLAGKTDSAVTKAEAAVATELTNPRFRINAEAGIRRFVPEDEQRIGEIANRLGLDTFYEGGRTTVLEAKGHGVVGYGQIIPGWTRNGSVTPGKIEILGVLPEFRNRSNLLIKGMMADMKEVGGTWRTSAFDDTSGRLMRYFEKKNMVQVLDRWSGVSGRGQHPITHYTFSV